MPGEPPPPFSTPVFIRHDRRRHAVRFVAEAAGLLFTWPERSRRLRACRQALDVALQALDEKTPESVEAARVAFVEAARAVHVLEPG